MAADNSPQNGSHLKISFYIFFHHIPPVYRRNACDTASISRLKGTFSLLFLPPYPEIRLKIPAGRESGSQFPCLSAPSLLPLLSGFLPAGFPLFSGKRPEALPPDHIPAEGCVLAGKALEVVFTKEITFLPPFLRSQVREMCTLSGARAVKEKFPPAAHSTAFR